ncbi:MAG TPA: hypothetical protein VN540_06395 [Clostridia bacterium]|nr:hypothetical protein [Clostridia bacterium]
MKNAFSRRCVRLFVCAAILSACLAASACDTLPKDTKEAFLTVYLTTNYKHRYDVWEEIYNRDPPANMKPEDGGRLADEQIREATERLYRDVREYISDECYEEMTTYFQIEIYDQRCIEDGCTIRPTSFEFTEDSQSGDETAYSFKAHVIRTQDGAEESGVVFGDVTVRKDGNGEIVTRAFVAPGFLPDDRDD